LTDLRSFRGAQGLTAYDVSSEESGLDDPCRCRIF
jgi:hypothetical protein